MLLCCCAVLLCCAVFCCCVVVVLCGAVPRSVLRGFLPAKSGGRPGARPDQTAGKRRAWNSPRKLGNRAAGRDQAGPAGRVGAQRAAPPPRRAARRGLRTPKVTLWGTKGTSVGGHGLVPGVSLPPALKGRPDPTCWADELSPRFPPRAAPSVGARRSEPRAGGPHPASHQRVPSDPAPARSPRDRPGRRHGNRLLLRPSDPLPSSLPARPPAPRPHPRPPYRTGGPRGGVRDSSPQETLVPLTAVRPLR